MDAIHVGVGRARSDRKTLEVDRSQDRIEGDSSLE